MRSDDASRSKQTVGSPQYTRQGRGEKLFPSDGFACVVISDDGEVATGSEVTLESRRVRIHET